MALKIELEEENQILREILIQMMLREGVELKQSFPHEVKDRAKKLGLNPENVLEITESVIRDFVIRMFEKKKN
jgi:hypothetical protein